MSAPDGGFSNPTLEAVRRFLVRYQPFIITVTAIALIAFLLPGHSKTSQTAANQVDAAADTTAADTTSPGGVTAAVGGSTAAAPGARVAGTTTQAVANPNVLTFAQAKARGVALEKNCNLRTGFVKIPSWTAPQCVQALNGSNGGKTWQGVTDKKIVVAVYVAQSDPAVQAILTAAGDSDTPEQNQQQVREWVQEYEGVFNTWGRKAELHFVAASGASTDDAAAKADAIKVATQIKAFVSLGAPNNTYVNEVVARGVMCMCTVELPNKFYKRWSPYVWSTLQSADHTYQLLDEYLVKRLNNRKAKWAGQADFQIKNRVFGLLQYETRDYAYKEAAQGLIKALNSHGIKVKVVYFNGYPDLQANQEQARPAIQAMKAAGVTTIMCGCDPFAPIFFTQEATRQAYLPEWLDLGSALTDTTFFGRLYDPSQWTHAFGLGQLVARLPEKLGDSYRFYNWYFHKDPTARSGYGVIRAPIDVFYRGVHAAGPKLTPMSFQQGMFAQPEIGMGKKTVISVGFGNKYPVSQWTQFHDITEIWWNTQDCGADEVSAKNSCGGMWRYVNGGKRYLPGQIPTGEPNMFNTAGTVTVYNNYPPGEVPPSYPSIH